MDSVYEAVRTQAEKLKAELETLQNFLNLHDHFRDRFGLTPAATTTAASPEADAPAVDHAAATHEIHVQDAQAEPEAVAEAHAYGVEASASEEAEHLVTEHETSLHAEPETTTETEHEPRVIQASEGVLIAAPSEAEAEADAPLGPEATLQSLAEKLAATIGASHPSVTGYTV